MIRIFPLKGMATLPLLVTLLIIFQISASNATTTPKPRSNRQGHGRQQQPQEPTPQTTPAPQTQTKLSSGLYAQEIRNGPRLYESYAALTFDFQLPQEPNNLTMVFDYDCPNSEFSSSKFSCPVFYYLHKIRDKMRPTIELQQMRHPETSSDRAFNIPSCDALSKHFHTTTITPAKLEEYEELLRSCVDGLVVKSPVVTKFGPDSIRQKVDDYSLLIHGYVENFFQFLPRASRVDKAILLNTMISTNSLGLTHYLYEANMWAEALNDCKKSLIPSHLISPEVLKLNLLRLQHLVKQKNQDFVIPLTHGSISEYFKAPLSDCVMTGDTFHVRVLIPIKDSRADWKMYSLTSIPFIYNDGGDGTQLVCAVKEDDDSIYAFDQNSNRSFPLQRKFGGSTSKFGSGANNGINCDVNNDALCHTGRSGLALSFRHAKRNCASVSVTLAAQNVDQNQNYEVLKTDENEAMNKYCDLHCESVDEYQTPIIMRVASDRFYIVGQAKETIIVQCSSQLEIIHPPAEGAMEIILPCRCEIMFKTHRFLSQEPCGRNGSMTVSIVKPIHLAKVTVVESEVEVEDLLKDDDGNGRYQG